MPFDFWQWKAAIGQALAHRYTIDGVKWLVAQKKEHDLSGSHNIQQILLPKSLTSEKICRSVHRSAWPNGRHFDAPNATTRMAARSGASSNGGFAKTLWLAITATMGAKPKVRRKAVASSAAVAERMWRRLRRRP
ncbi:hypothetical protein, partial [Lichenifustis flavocetrariae]